MQTRLTEENLPRYLEQIGLLAAQEPVEITSAGDGNINWVRRVQPKDGRRSFVVKQARPALERFPEYEVTTERIGFEAAYYAVVRELGLRVCPDVIHFDETERVLVLEDLGPGPRLDALLEDDVPVQTFHELGGFLSAVHGATSASLESRFRNEAMRRLHGDHIFALPLRANDFPLSRRLRDRAEALWQDRELVQIADRAYERYRGPGRALVHADVQPSNVVLCAGTPRLLDAEIAHVGDPAFDLGTLLGHVLLAATARGRPEQAAPAARAAWSAYRAGPGPSLRFEDVARYAGLEMLRRTIGAARVPGVQRDEPALAVLEAALGLVRRPPASPP
jgi:5-methylthioribose kinase